MYTTAVGYAGGFTPNPTYEEVCSGRTGHNEVVLVAYRPEEISYDELLRLFWEGHDPTQGMRQGNDVGTQYRSGIYVTSDAQREAALASRELLPAEAGRGGLRRDHDRDRGRSGVLLRRGLPPAVPGQEPGRLLRAGRHRGELSRWAFRSCRATARPRYRGRQESAHQLEPVVRPRRASCPRRPATRPTRRARRRARARRRRARSPARQACSCRWADPPALRRSAAPARVTIPLRARVTASRPGFRPGPPPRRRRGPSGSATAETHAARRPASQRPSAERTTHSAVRLSQAPPSISRSAQRAGWSSMQQPTVVFAEGHQASGHAVMGRGTALAQAPPQHRRQGGRARPGAHRGRRASGPRPRPAATDRGRASRA